MTDLSKKDSVPIEKQERKGFWQELLDKGATESQIQEAIRSSPRFVPVGSQTSAIASKPNKAHTDNESGWGAPRYEVFSDGSSIEVTADGAIILRGPQAPY